MSMGAVTGTWTKGYVAIADVVDFSEREGPEQLRIVEHLNESFSSGLRRLGADPEACAVNFTGDGFLLAVTHESRVSPEAFLDFTEGFLSSCDGFAPLDGQPPLRVRIGIHAGPFHFPVAAFGRNQVVGIAPNWCARVVSVAGPAQIVVSESFFSDLCQSLGRKAAVGKVFPDDAPMDIPVKHGRMLEARLWQGDRPGVEPSQRLQRLQEAHAYLESELRLIVDSVGAFFERGRRRIPPERSRPRITLWTCRGGVLEPTAYRYAFGFQAAQPGSTTRYSLKPPQGPLARCLATRAPASRIGLPSYRHDPDGYLEALGTENLTVDQVQKFSFKSQAFLAIPCGLGPESDPKLALCLDFADPLLGCEEKVDEVGKGLMARVPRVACLWALRTE